MQTFEQWWDENYAPAFATLPGAMALAFKEVGQKSWEAKPAQDERIHFDDWYAGLSPQWKRVIDAANSGEPSAQQDEREAFKDLLSYAESTICYHEETHRGGAIWTICDCCGKKWADDEGGFQPAVEPAAVIAARELLSHPAQKVQADAVFDDDLRGEYVRAIRRCNTDDDIRIAVMAIERRVKESIEGEQAQADVVTPNYFPFLSDRADGYKGHYAIARYNPTKGHREYIGPRGEWVGCGAALFSLSDATEKMRDMLTTCPVVQAAGAVESDDNVFDWLETELSAVDCVYRGSPTYDHDAYWFREKAIALVAEARNIFAKQVQADAQKYEREAKHFVQAAKRLCDEIKQSLDIIDKRNGGACGATEAIHNKVDAIVTVLLAADKLRKMA